MINIAYPQPKEELDLNFNSLEVFIITYLKYKKIEFNLFKIDDIDNFNYDNIDYILFSFYDYEDIINLMKLNDLKLQNRIRSKIIVGGPQFDFIKDIYSFEKILSEIDYFVIGKGEEALYNILKNKPNKKIHYDNEYETDYKFYYNETPVINTTEHGKVGIVNLSHNICFWNRCKFCGIVESYRKGFYLSISNIIPKIRKSYENGIKTFYFYDNAITLSHLKKLLTKLSDLKDIQFIFFGIKANKNFTELNDILKNFNTNPIFRVSIGLEFYSQEILDIYDKGVDLENINTTVDFFYNIGTEVGLSILFSLPLVEHKHVDFFENWIKDNIHKTSELGTSVLRLRDNVKIFENPHIFGIKILGNYTYYDYIDDSLIYNDDIKDKLKKIELSEVDFLYKNEEYDRIFTRDEIYNIYYKNKLEKYTYLDDDFIRKKN